MRKFLLLACMLLPGLGVMMVKGQQTVGLFQYDSGTTDGYVFFGPLSSTNSYLIDNCGRIVNVWPSAYVAGPATKLLNNGSILRAGKATNAVFGSTGGSGGMVETIDWSGTQTWEMTISDNTYCSHHDLLQMPNGNVLVTVWERVDSVAAVAEGRNPSTLAGDLWSEMLLELKPTGMGTADTVWKWRVWDHLVQEFDSSKAHYGVVSDHPELFNLNYFDPTSKTNWMHVNGISYNAQRDEIAISSHRWDEIWIIDHSTTTQQAAGHTGGTRGKGGDILYRYGNPQTYGRGTVGDQRFFGQHNIDWVPAGDSAHAGMLQVFNNGFGRPAGPYSSLEIFEPPMDGLGNYDLQSGQPYGPAAPTWIYSDSGNFYSAIVSNYERLSNGNTFVCEGQPGRFFEMDAQMNRVWTYVNPVVATGPVNQGDSIFNNISFRANRIPAGHPALTGHNLTPQDRIEGNPLPLPSNCTGSASESPLEALIEVFPNPATSSLTIRRTWSKVVEVQVCDLQGRVLQRGHIVGKEARLELEGLVPGMYILRIGEDSALKFSKL